MINSGKNIFCFGNLSHFFMKSKKPDEDLSSLMMEIGTFLLLFAIPFYSWRSENTFRDETVAFHEVEDRIILTDHCRPEFSLSDCLMAMDAVDSKWPVHVTSNVGRFPLTGSARDIDFGLVYNDALELERTTEYCQWERHSGKNYSYYKKTWRLERINGTYYEVQTCLIL